MEVSYVDYSMEDMENIPLQKDHGEKNPPSREKDYYAFLKNFTFLREIEIGNYISKNFM